MGLVELDHTLHGEAIEVELETGCRLACRTPRRTPVEYSRPSIVNWIIAAGLVLLTAVAYAQVVGFEFTNYDDTAYVPDNAHVRDGFSLRGIGWAFTTFETANWYPLDVALADAGLPAFRPAAGGESRGERPFARG